MMISEVVSGPLMARLLELDSKEWKEHGGL